MAQTFCGKSCNDCVKKEALNCPGCRVGPARNVQCECDLAQCCRSRGHETCETCNFKIRCGKYLRREFAPDDRLRRINAEQERFIETGRRTPMIARWMRVLLWLVIPNVIGSLLTNNSFKGWFPNLYLPGLILLFGSNIAYCAVLFVMAKLEESYRKAGLYSLICIVIAALNTLADDSQAVTLLLAIPSIIISLLSVYHEFHSHSDVMVDVDSQVSNSWITLWQAYIVIYGMLYGGVFLMIISVVLGFFTILVGAIGSVIIGIVQLVLLHKSAKSAEIITVMAQNG